MVAVSRRNFIKSAVFTPAVLSSSETLMSCAPKGKLLKDFGLQLYTVRDVLPKDPKAALRQIWTMGYTQIESYEGDEGMFWGMTNVEFKKLMDDLGMEIVSSHTDIRTDFQRKAAAAAEIGMAYLVDPWEGPQKSIDDYKRIADLFNEKGQVCKDNGIRFAYHNHGYTFEPIDGQMPQDILMQNTNPDLVDFEMDVYWVVTARQDPIEWFRRYPKRWRLGHLKDRRKNVPADSQDETCVLGTGIIDWKKIMKAALNSGMEYFIVEQEQYDRMTSMEAARQDAQYLKNFRF